jgi:polysaccharide export outer membrane protein
MKLYIYLLIIMHTAFSILVSAEELDNYKLSVDDQITVTVFQEPELSIKEVRVSTDGNISFPLIGQIKVQGLTITEIEDAVTKLLLDGYLKKPNVSVTITEYRPFYIKGEVKNSGSYPYRKGLTIEKAVALAGGFRERASKSNIKLSREGIVKTINEVALGDEIKPGDVITVTESFF